MEKTFSLLRGLIASDDFRCLSIDSQAMYLQCCAHADDTGIIRNFWLIRDSYMLRSEEDILKELTEAGYIVEDTESPCIARIFKIAHWDNHKGK